MYRNPAIFLIFGQFLAIKNLKMHMSLAILIFTNAFLAVNSQPKRRASRMMQIFQ